MAARNIIVMGASAGGIDALRRVVATLPATLPAAVCITLHMPGRGGTALCRILSQAATLPTIQPTNKEQIVPGQIYIAPPDSHLLLAPGFVSLGHGPKENLQRPCINVMFRSAAAAYGPAVIGVLLTGLLDDGASGLWEIKQRGGITIAQDPQDAAYPSMPESAIRGFAVDHVVRLAEMGPLLMRLVSSNGTAPMPPVQSNPAALSEACGETCPECGGAMTRRKLDRLYEYRCHTGHRFGLKTMIADKSDLVERMLFAALAQTEELTPLLERAMNEGDPSVKEELSREIQSRLEQARIIRQLLESRISSSLE